MNGVDENKMKIKKKSEENENEKVKNLCNCMSKSRENINLLKIFKYRVGYAITSFYRTEIDTAILKIKSISKLWILTKVSSRVFFFYFVSIPEFSLI